MTRITYVKLVLKIEKVVKALWKPIALHVIAEHISLKKVNVRHYVGSDHMANLMTVNVTLVLLLAKLAKPLINLVNA